MNITGASIATEVTLMGLKATAELKHLVAVQRFYILYRPPVISSQFFRLLPWKKTCSRGAAVEHALHCASYAINVDFRVAS